MKKTLKRNLAIVSEAIWIWSLLVWGYISAENLVNPVAVATQPLAEYVPIKQNILVLAAFVVAFVFFILWRYLKD